MAYLLSWAHIILTVTATTRQLKPTEGEWRAQICVCAARSPPVVNYNFILNWGQTFLNNRLLFQPPSLTGLFRPVSSWLPETMWQWEYYLKTNKIFKMSKNPIVPLSHSHIILRSRSLICLLSPLCYLWFSKRDLADLPILSTLCSYISRITAPTLCL